MKCLNCGKEFEAVRSTAKYCSDKCKLDYNRGLSVSINDVVSVSDTPIDTVSNRLPANYGQDDCQCLHCLSLKINDIKGKLNHGSYMDAQELKLNGYIANRVTLPGDIDYVKDKEENYICI